MVSMQRSVTNLVLTCWKTFSLHPCVCVCWGRDFAGVWVVTVRDKPKENAFALKER